MPDSSQPQPKPREARYGETQADAAAPTPAAPTPAAPTPAAPTPAAPTPAARTPPAGDRYGKTSADTPAPALGGLADAFRIVTLIAEGGMGRVYLAHDNSLDRLVALKRMAAEHVADARLRQRFLTEARASSRLNHYHIVQVYRLGEDAAGPFIAMEFVPGPLPPRRVDWPADAAHPSLDLDEFVKLKGPLDLAAVVRLGRQLLSAVGYAHRSDVIHRDIKPANILLTTQHEAKLADFGLARHLDGSREGQTLAGAQLLTLGYGAPEQEIDASRADHRADLYAVAATLWFALTGHNPRFFRESDVPAALRSALVRALERDREKRFQSAADFDDALAKFGKEPAAPVAAVPAVPVAASVPVAAVPLAAGVGKCPKCGHQHYAATVASLKYCEQCGNGLMEPCINCTNMNGLWAKFCASCGIDIAAHGQQTIVAKTAELQQARALAEQGDFPQACQILERICAQKHPRLTAIVARAAAQLEETRTLQAAAEQVRDEKVRQARKLLEDRRLEQADQTLDSVPAPLRNAAFGAVREELRPRLAERDQLRREISEQLRNRQYRGVLAKVERMVVLDPHDRYYADLVPIARENEKAALKDAWYEACDTDTSAGYTAFLDLYPDGARAVRAGELLKQATRRELLAQPKRPAARRHYLALRDRALAVRDALRALVGVAILYAIIGGVGGAVIGGTCTMLTYPVGNHRSLLDRCATAVVSGSGFRNARIVMDGDHLSEWAITYAIVIAGAIGGALAALTRSAAVRGSGCVFVVVLCLIILWAVLAIMHNTGPRPQIGMDPMVHNPVPPPNALQPVPPHAAPRPAWRSGRVALALVPGMLFGSLFGLLVGAPLAKAKQFGPLPWLRYASPVAALNDRFLASPT
jgi:serine/threonine protein kinase